MTGGVRMGRGRSSNLLFSLKSNKLTHTLKINTQPLNNIINLHLLLNLSNSPYTTLNLLNQSTKFSNHSTPQFPPSRQHYWKEAMNKQYHPCKVPSSNKLKMPRPSGINSWKIHNNLSLLKEIESIKFIRNNSNELNKCINGNWKKYKVDIKWKLNYWNLNYRD